MFELGFISRSDLFSGPGSLAELSFSALRVFSVDCACASSPANAAVVTRAAGLTPRKLRLEKPVVSGSGTSSLGLHCLTGSDSLSSAFCSNSFDILFPTLRPMHWRLPTVQFQRRVNGGALAR